MSTTLSPIMFKGFMLGYLHKAAMSTPTPGDPDSDDPAGAFAPAGEYNPKKLSKEEQERQAAAQAEGKPALPRLPDPYSDFGGRLADLWPGAAIGTAVAGGGSVAFDAMRKKKINAKRAILLALLAGLPLGAAGQLGVMGGWEGMKDFGGSAAGAGKQALADILRGGGEVYGGAKAGWDKGVKAGKRKFKGGINA